MAPAALTALLRYVQRGDLAAAGTLMMGGAPQPQHHTPRLSGSAGSGPPPTDLSSLASRLPPPKVAAANNNTVVEELGMEDLEDVDAMLALEDANGGLNNDLAAKLRQFEAMQDDD